MSTGQSFRERICGGVKRWYCFQIWRRSSVGRRGKSVNFDGVEVCVVEGGDGDEDGDGRALIVRGVVEDENCCLSMFAAGRI